MSASDNTGVDSSANRIGSWFQTFTAGRFWPFEPRADEVNLIDIAHALSLQCRYNGHCREFYSVAEHSVRVSMAIETWADLNSNTLDDYEQAVLAFWGLMHDAAEAYVGDMVRPLKHHMPAFRAVEASVMAAICERFGMAIEEPAIVKHFDNVILRTEKRDIVNGDLLWSFPPEIQPLPEKIIPWSPAEAERRFLARFDELGGKR